MKPRYKTSVKNNLIILTEPLEVAIKQLNGKDVDITICETKTQRSINQNNYYWGVVVSLIGDELGYMQDEVHEILKSMFLKTSTSIDTKHGVVEVQHTKSTASLSTSEFEDYMSKVRTWASVELNIYIPTPNEVEI